MLALILAGGGGSRLGMGEKPLVNVLGVPMLERVIRAFEGAGLEVVVALTSRTPFTANWCRAHRIDHLLTSGLGYVEDIVEAVGMLEERGPLFTSVSDLPCISPRIVRRIREVYSEREERALSTWVPCELILEAGCVPRHVELVDGIHAGAAGINILLGEKISHQQEEFRFLLREPALAYNVNTREERENAERYLRHLGYEQGQDRDAAG